MVSTLLCGAMLLSPVLAFYCEGPSGWARQEVRAAIDSGFPDWEAGMGLNGWPETMFPNKYPTSISRTNFCHIIATILAKDKNMASLPQYIELYDAGYRSKFIDMYRVSWNYDVFLANYLGIIDGVSETEFDPYGTLTREQAAKIMAETVKVLRPSLWQEGKDYLAGKDLRDQGNLSPWAANYVGFMLELGLMRGVGNGNFAPQEPYSTEQAIVSCYRLCQKLQVSGTIPTEKANLWLDTYRMGRYIQYFLADNSSDPNVADISVYYGGVSDEVSKVSVEKFTVVGIGALGKPHHTYDSDPYCKGELHVAAHNMQKDTYYTAHVALTLTMANGKKQHITDTFVFLF